jgi:hypothetical protein
VNLTAEAFSQHGGIAVNITTEQLNAAVEAGILSARQAKQLRELADRSMQQTYSISHLLFFLSATLLLSGIFLLLSLSWKTYGNLGLLSLSSGFIALGWVALHLLRQRKLDVPAALCASFILLLTPLFLHSLTLALQPESVPWMSFNALSDALHWLWIEILTALLGIIAYRVYGYHFIFFPIAVCLGFIPMSLARCLEVLYPDLDALTFFMITMGLMIIAGAYRFERRYHQRLEECFWLYGVGGVLLGFGLNMQSHPTELKQFLAFLGSLGLLKLGQYVQRNIFYIVGGLGVLFYITHLAYTWFNQQWAFVLLILLIGFLCLGAGVACARVKLRS